MGMRNLSLIKTRVTTIFETARQRLCMASFVALHRRREEDFIRQCKLPFCVVMLLILQKTLKSLQLHLHEFMAAWARMGHELMSVSNSALTHARGKLEASAFVDLNENAVLFHFYGPEFESAVQRWRGRRLLAMDGSLIRLPSSPQLFEEFGEVAISNQHGKHDRYPQGRISVLYDVLNHIALEGHMVSSQQGEIELARKHLAQVKADDVILTDRGYAGYRWFGECLQKAQFICRCSCGSFAVVQELMARDEPGVSRTVKLRAPAEEVAELKRLGLPLELTVRFVTLRLSTGELEVLATSLLDEVLYPTDSFGEVYWKRWGVETFYGRLKGRLDLENFSGKTVKAVHQDFQATLFLSNLESVVSAPVEAQLPDPATAQQKYPVQVNKAVSFHALKYHVIELLASSAPLEEVLTKVEQWLLHNPVTVRKERKVTRRKASAFRSANFSRRVRKIVF